MARNRTVWPELWGDAKLARVSRDARLTFIGMWNFADDYGVIKANPDWLRANIFEGDDSVTIALIKKWLSELESIQVILPFVADDEKGYYFIRSWDIYQRVDKKSKRRFPEPPSIDSLLFRESAASVDLEPRESPDVVISDLQSPISNLQSPISTSVEQGSTENSPHSESCRIIFEYWQAQLNHPRAKLDSTRKKAITARLKEGYPIERIKQAIDGIKTIPHNMGQNDRNTVFDDIELICRNGKNIDRFADALNNKSAGQAVDIGRYQRAGIKVGPL